MVASRDQARKALPVTGRDTLPEAVARLARFTKDLAMPCALIGLDDALAIRDAFGSRLDRGYLCAQATRLGEEVLRRLDLLLL